MSSTSVLLDRAVEEFLDARQADPALDVASYASLHPELEPDLGEALESLLALESVRKEDSPSQLPERLGRFRVVREIGRGGMGVVAEAIEEPLGRRVALKLFPRELLVSPSARTRFQREAALASRLDHSGICTVYGAGVLDDQPWISMRCIDGETLGHRIKSARGRGELDLRLPGSEGLDPARAVARCIARVARALAAAHSKGVLHRDVKPSNVMVTASGEPVLLDFGLAIEPESDAAKLTRTGDIAGTPAYLAPELIAGEVARSDAHCDVYALGVTLYECLALEPPFRGPTRVALYRSVLSGDALDVRRANPSVPRDLAVVVAAASERDRSARYASAEQLALDLEAVVEHHPISARPIGPWGRLARWIRREPRQALLAGFLAAAALVAALSAGALLASRDKVRAGEIAQREREIDDAILGAFLDLNDGRRAEALARFEHVLALDPANEEARVGRVFALLRQKRNAEALELLRDEPATPAYEGLRALASGGSTEIGDEEWIATASAHELFLDGERLRIAGARRPISEQAAWMRKALERFDEAVLRAPQPRALYHSLRGWVAASAGDLPAVRSAANALALLWPDSEGAAYQAGSSLVDLDPLGALPHLERAARLDPGRAATFQCIGTAYCHLRRMEEAHAALVRANELEPGNVMILNTFACVYSLMECPDEQRAALDAVLDLDHRFVPALSNLALLQAGSGDVDGALLTLEHLLDLDPGLMQQREFYAQLLHHRGDPRLARDQMAMVLAAMPDDAGKWIEFAKHSYLAGELDDVLDSLAVARSIDPARPELDPLEQQALSARDQAALDREER